MRTQRERGRGRRAVDAMGRSTAAERRQRLRRRALSGRGRANVRRGGDRQTHGQSNRHTGGGRRARARTRTSSCDGMNERVGGSSRGCFSQALLLLCVRALSPSEERVSAEDARAQTAPARHARGGQARPQGIRCAAVSSSSSTRLHERGSAELLSWRRLVCCVDAQAYKFRVESGSEELACVEYG